MRKQFCQYCGAPLKDGCDCERVVAEEVQQRLEDYYEDPEVQYGWHQQDIIDMYRRER